MSLISIGDTGYLFNPQTMEIITDSSIPPREVSDKEEPVKTKGSFGIQLLVTSSCNLNCEYCFGADHVRLSMDSSTVSNVTKFVQRLLEEYDRVEINFFGGEPLLNRPAMKQLIQELSGCDRIDYALTTNGSLVDEDVVKLLSDCNAGVCVSLDGPEHIHDMSRKHQDGTGSFKGAMRALDMVGEAGLRCSLESVVNLDKQLAVEQFDFLRTLKVSRIQMSFNYYYDYPLSERSVNSMADQIGQIRSKYLADLQELRQRCYAFAFGPCFGSDILLMIHNMVRRKNRCREEGLAVSPDGHMYHCAALTGNEQFHLGSLNSPIPSGSRQKLNAICEECWAKCFCGGTCALQDSIYSDGPDPGLCAVYKEASQAALRTYIDIIDTVWEVLAYFERPSGQKKKQ